MKKYAAMIVLILFTLSGFAGVSVVIGNRWPGPQYLYAPGGPLAPRPVSYEAIALYNRGMELLKEEKKEQAIALFRQAAEPGYMEAQRQLAWMLYYGLGTPANRTESASWFLKAAEQNDPFSQNLMARHYYFGDGIEKDLKKAAYWSQRGAENGLIDSQLLLGYLYRHGHGVAKNPEMAAIWYERAFKAGNGEGAYRLAVLYQAGEGVKQNEEKAAELFWFAKNKGYKPE